jgi:hypothetical protein
MAINATSSPPTKDPDVNLYIRVIEDFFGIAPWGAANTTPQQHVFGPVLSGLGTNLSMLQNTGGGTCCGGQEVDGRRIMQMTSAAGYTFRRGGECSMPLSQTFQTAGALVGINTNRRPRRYLFSVAARRTVAGTARWNMAMTETDGGLVNLTRPGIGWVSDAAVNGGNWTPASRRLNGGALVLGADTGISPAAFHLLGLRYTEGLTPRIEWLLDGVPRQLIEGDANMLVYPGGGTQLPGWIPEYGQTGPAGQIFQMGPALYEVHYIG